MQEIDGKLNNLVLDSILRKIKGVTKKEDLAKFLGCFLTPREQLRIKKRLLTDIFLKRGKTYREIGELLDISRNTVSFVKKGFKRPLKKEKVHKPVTAKDLKKRKSRFPTMTGRGRWRFLNVKY